MTAGDVAARAGLPLAQTSAALNALAADTGATLRSGSDVATQLSPPSPSTSK